MSFKNVCVYGFDKSSYLFMMPAIRYILGTVRAYHTESIEYIRQHASESDILCVNCSISFYDLELFFKFVSDSCSDKKKPVILCLSWTGVPQENLDIMLHNKADLIMFDLESEEEFSFCRDAYLKGKSFRSQGTFGRGEEFYCDRLDIYNSLSKNQKYAFMYMMTGKTQKELQVDFGFNSLNTAASHWHKVLDKFKVRSVFELRSIFR